MRIGTTISLCVIVLATAASVHGQPAPNRQPSQPASPLSLQPSGGAEKAQRMYEDVEIMRQLLNRRMLRLVSAKSCAACHQVGLFNNNAGMEEHWHADTILKVHGESFLPPGNGLYLPGRGVVYQSTMPAIFAQLQSFKSIAKDELSDWEKIRKQLRGEKSKQEGAADKAHHMSVEDVILQVLAEKGRHFSGLAANETITVAVTFSGAARKTQVRAGRLGESSSMTQLNMLGALTALGEYNSDLKSYTAQSKIRDREMLGDMKLKQGKVEEAIREYEALLRQLATSAQPRPAQNLSLYRKIIGACMKQMKDGAKRRELLGKAAQYLELARKMESAGTSPAARLTRLPARLIVSVAKRILDQVGAGKMSFGEFRQEAQVVWLRFGVKEAKASGK